MVEERGVAAVLGYDPGLSTDGHADSRQDDVPSDPLVPDPAASTFSLDPTEIEKTLDDFINKLLEEDKENAPDDWDSESETSGSSLLSPDEDESELESNADSAPTNDFGADNTNTLDFEPIIMDGELDQSSSYVRAEDLSMMDPMLQLESSLAEMSMEDAIGRGSPEFEVDEPEGEYSFLQDSPASSDRTSTPPNWFFDGSMTDTQFAAEIGSNSNRSPTPESHYNVDSSMADSSTIGIPGAPLLEEDQTRADDSVNTSSDDNSSENGRLPGPRWGAPIGEALPLLQRLHQEKMAAGSAPAAPFADWLEFEFVKWMVERDISQGSREKLLGLPLIVARARLSFGSNYTLNNLIDALPLAGPKWNVKAVKITGDKLGPDGKPLTETVELWYRDILGVIQELLENHTYGKDLVFAPCEKWNDAKQTERVYDEMWTGDWWKRLQVNQESGVLPPDATILPVILASDATHLTNFGGGKQAYPVYITLGNIPKAIRRQPNSYGTLLLGYLPAQKLECFTEKGKTHQKERLFHQCMTEIVKPLEQAGREGVEMICGDGKIRRCFPILAAYCADNPEKTLVACCKKNLCYRCTVERDKRGDYAMSPDRHHVDSANALIAQARRQRPTQYLVDNGLHPFGEPFWARLPHCNIYAALTPDLLHQLHKGVFKDHVMSWCLKLVDETEFNDRFKAMPGHSGLRHFAKNVSELSQTTGKEHREMEKVFLGVMAGLVPNDVMPALRALLDFIYYAQLPAHTTTTISWLEDALRQFHDSKDVFIQHGTRKHFNINKLHSMMHYAQSIRELGALDGYNTEGPERLHINFAKRAYKATNRNNFISQMVQYLERRERVFKFDTYLRWAVPEYAEAHRKKDEEWAAKRASGWHIALKSPFKPVSQDCLPRIFGINWFKWVLDKFFDDENLEPEEIDPKDQINVFPKATQLIQDDAVFSADGFSDIVHATPHSQNKLSFEKDGSKFDTVLIERVRSEEPSYGISKHFVAQVRLIFTLPAHYGIPDPLVCVRMFRSPTTAAPTQLTGLYRVQPMRYSARYDFQPVERIFFLSDIRRTCHLIPEFGPGRNPFWASAPPALKRFDAFYANAYLDPHSHIFFQC
ncbi:hypothetical protein FRC08_002802 [Ceratobasidium sp. 394]|nr:hypothetical protein FRC08_002802 [Ceratobasidium sp. 394]